MSIVLRREDLSEEQLQLILQHLVIVPKEKFFRRRWWGQNSEQTGKRFPFFLSEDGDGGGRIRIPYFFSRGITGKRNNDNREFLPAKFSFRGELLDYQPPVVRDAHQSLDTEGCVILNLCTAFGKTVIGAVLSSLRELLTLVLVTNTNLIEQWDNTFRDFTDAKRWMVGEKSLDGIPDVIISMDTRIDKIPSALLDRVGMLIIDEAHLFCTPSRVKALLCSQPRYVISMTATLERENETDIMIPIISGPTTIVRISQKPFNVIKYNTGIDIPIKENAQRSPDWNELVNDLCANENRNRLILDLVRSNPDFKILIITARRDHTTDIHNWLLQMEESVDYMIGGKKSYSDSRVLVGTTKKLGTGFDEKALCQNFNGIRINLLLLVCSTKSRSLLEQIAGRCFRAEFPQIIHFVDADRISQKHWKAVSPWYPSRNGTIYESDSPFVMKEREVPVQESHIERLFREGKL